MLKQGCVLHMSFVLLLRVSTGMISLQGVRVPRVVLVRWCSFRGMYAGAHACRETDGPTDKHPSYCRYTPVDTLRFITR